MNRLKQISIVPLLALLTLLAACPNPVQEAKSPELKAQALFAEFTLAEEAAGHLIRSPQVPNSVKVGIQDAHAAATPIVEALEAQRKSIAVLRLSKPEDVPAALLALNDLIIQVQPLIGTFKSRATQ